MSQAEDLLNSLSTDDVSLYTANPETEEHIVIGEDRYIKVPNALKRIAVQHDHNVETVTFDCPRYWDDTDLSTLYIWINYIRKDRVTGRYLAKNRRVDENDSNMIHFDWTIGNEITEVDGPIVFLVCALKTNSEGMEEVHWNSEKCPDCFVSEGMECADTTMNEYPDIITDLLTRMDTIIAANSTILDTSLTQAGLAADARATGEAINAVDNRVTEIVEGTDYTTVTGNPIHLKEASRNNANLTPIGVIEQEVIEAEAGTSVVGESIHVTDVDTTKEASIYAGANTTQETREGYNLLNLEKYYYNENDSQSNNGTITIENGILKMNGTNATARLTAKSINFVKTSENIDILPAGTYYFGVNTNGYYEDDLNALVQFTIGVQTLTKNYKLTQWYYPCGIGEIVERPLIISKDTNKTTYEQFGAMPSIDFPSEIKSVGGESTNLIDLSTLENQTKYGVDITFDKEKGSIILNGTPTSNTILILPIKEEIVAGTTISFGAFNEQVTSTTGSTIRTYDSNTSNNEKSCDFTIIDRKVENYTLNHNLTHMQIRISIDDVYDNFEIFPMLRLGATLGEFIKYGYSRYTFDVVNKNLIDNEWEQGNISISTGTEENSNNYIRTKNYQKIVPNVLYKLSRTIATGYMYFRFYDKNYKFLGTQFSEGFITTDQTDNRMYAGVTSMKLTINNTDIAYMKCCDNSNDLTTKYQLEIGDTATDYIAHQSQSLNLDIPEGIELNKLGDVSDKIDFTFTMDETGYKTIDRDSVKHVGNAFKKNLSTITSWNKSSRYTGSFFATLSDMKIAHFFYCNRAKYVQWEDDYKLGNCLNNGSLSIWLSEDFTSVDEWKAFLAENETYIVYPISTPVITPITDETFISQLEALINIKPYEGVTNVFVTSSDDGSCLPLTEFLYNYVTAAPSIKRPTPVLGIGTPVYENLLDFNVTQDSRVTVNKDGTITINGAGGFNINCKPINLKSGVNYTQRVELVSGTVLNDTKPIMNLKGSSFIPYNSIKNTFTLDEDAEKSTVWVGSSGTHNNATFKIWAYEGTDIHPFTPPGRARSELYHTGANLFNKDKVLTLNNVTVSDLPNGVRVTSTGDGSSKFAKYILADISNLLDKAFSVSAKFKASSKNEPMVILGRCDKNGNLKNSVKLDTSGSFVTTKFDENPDYPYLCVNLYANNNGTAKAGDYVDYTDIHVEILDGTADTPMDYTEYQNDIINLDLPEGIELFEGESIYKEEGKWYHYKEWYKEYITSNSTVSRGGTNTTDIFRFKIFPKLEPKKTSSVSSVMEIYSNIVKKGSPNSTYTCEPSITPDVNDKVIFIYLEETKLMTAEEFKTYCEERGIHIVYKLANPGPEEITDATLLDQLNTLSKLKTYKGVNNFFLTSAGADGLMKLEYRKFDLVGIEDLEKYEGRIDDLEDEIDKKAEELSGKIDDVYVPTKVSELENDTGFAERETLFTEFVSVKHQCVESKQTTPGGVEQGTKTFTKDGYYPIAIAGWSLGELSTPIQIRQLYIKTASKGSATVYYDLKNTDGTNVAASELYCYILWAK